MSTLPKTHLTPEQYLEIERKAERKSEYYAGEMFAMAGASKEHGLITVNLVAVLHNQLRRSACRTFVADLRVNIPATGLYTYPDIVVACGELSDAFGPELTQRQAAALPQARVDVLAGLGHFGPLQDPAAVAASIVGAFSGEMTPL